MGMAEGNSRAMPGDACRDPDGVAAPPMPGDAWRGVELRGCCLFLAALLMVGCM